MLEDRKATDELRRAAIEAGFVLVCTRPCCYSRHAAMVRFLHGLAGCRLDVAPFGPASAIRDTHQRQLPARLQGGLARSCFHISSR